MYNITTIFYLKRFVPFSAARADKKAKRSFAWHIRNWDYWWYWRSGGESGLAVKWHFKLDKFSVLFRSNKITILMNTKTIKTLPLCVPNIAADDDVEARKCPLMLHCYLHHSHEPPDEPLFLSFYIGMQHHWSLWRFGFVPFGLSINKKKGYKKNVSEQRNTAHIKRWISIIDD